VSAQVPAPQIPAVAVHSSTLLQVPPVGGASYPAGHAQEYDPSTFAQVPVPQIPGRLTHSFVSTQPRRPAAV
jgi:hypothetical protein